jgi:hypothetical protein
MKTPLRLLVCVRNLPRRKTEVAMPDDFEEI